MVSQKVIFVLTILISLVLQNQHYVTADKALIVSTCRKTTYPDICISTLTSEPRSLSADLTGLGRISLDITAKKLAEGASKLNDLVLHTKDYEIFGIYRLCYDSYNDSLAELKKHAIPSFEQHKYNLAFQSVHNVNGALAKCDKFKRANINAMNAFTIKLVTDVEKLVTSIN